MTKIYNFTKQNIVNAIFKGNLEYPMIEIIEIKRGSQVNSYKVTSRGFDEYGYVGKCSYFGKELDINDLVFGLSESKIKSINERTINIAENVLGKVVRFELYE